MTLKISNDTYEVFKKLKNVFDFTISEDQLNSLLLQPQDLQSLSTLLELKLGFINDNLQTRINFPVNNIFKQANDDNVDEICSVLHLSLQVQDNDRQYKALLKNIEVSLTNERNEQKFLNALRVLKFLLSYQQTCLNIDFVGVLCDLLFYNVTSLTNFLIVNIFSKVISGNGSCINKIFRDVYKNALATNDLTVLCGLSNYIMEDLEFMLHDEFWCLLQNCLHKSNEEKQAVYLLKIILQALKYKDSFSTPLEIISWNATTKEEFYAAWANFFTVLEVLNEKQLHLIEPSYHLLTSVKVLHPKWLAVLYSKLLAHSHSSVQRYAIVEVLKSTWWHKSDVFEKLAQSLLSALNYNDNVSRPEIWIEIRIFQKRLEEKEFLILLEESVQVVWLPSICYQFYSNVLINKRRVKVGLIEKIINTVEKLPHKFIRKACIELIRKFISKFKFTFHEFVDLNWALGKENGLLEENIDYKEYKPHIVQIMKTWCGNSLVNYPLNHKHAVVLKMLEPAYKFKFDSEELVKAFKERRLSLEILDEAVLLLCKKDRVVDLNLPHYLSECLARPRLNKEVKEIINDHLLLSSPIRYHRYYKTRENLLSLYELCLKSLDSYKSFIELEIAYETAVTILKYTNHNRKLCVAKPKFYSNWKDNFLTNAYSTPIALLFLRSYFYEHSFNWNDELPIYERAIEVYNQEILPLIAGRLRYVLTDTLYNDDVERFIDFLLKAIVESKRTNCFKPAILKFIYYFFDWKVVVMFETVYNDYNERLLNKIVNITNTLLDLAKLCSEVSNSLVERLSYFLSTNTHLLQHFIPVLVKILISGDILKKDQRAEYLICQKVYEWGLKEENPNLLPLSTLARAIETIETFLNNDSIEKKYKSESVDEMTKLLIEKYNIHLNKRYYADSTIHLEKLRILQALLLIHKFIKIQKRTLICFLIDILCSESHQISIKFLIQWLLITLLSDSKRHSVDTIKSKMEITNKAQPSTIIAFVPILYHLALSKNEEQSWINIFETMLPWTMGAHFNLRLYAQEGLIYLFEQAEHRKFNEFISKFKSTIECIENVLDQTERKLDPIDRFFFDTFNVKKFNNAFAIYYTIPKLTNVIYDQYENFVNIELFKSEILNTDWQIKPLIVPQSDKEMTISNVIQKKITPWAHVICDNKKRPTVSELIVVATLIDKIPNLGGISRTCEVFGVKQLVIPSLNNLKSNEFQSLSMSSENWIDIMEIKVDNLKSYLFEMKEKDYVLVAAEQTSNSVMLEGFSFPKKCVLVLGNEKEGVSPNVLPLIDFCVEIPQFGLVRSLNVHVAAATFIWEYTKQHVIQKT